MEFFLVAIDAHIRRETSNKALNAINDIRLVPFLMSFLAARDRLSLGPVTAAGAFYSLVSRCSST